MIRDIYRCLLWLHPASFEEQFAEEFLWIFDLRRASERGIGLIFDCLISVCRQWLFHSDLWKFGIGVLVDIILGHQLLFGV